MKLSLDSQPVLPIGARLFSHDEDETLRASYARGGIAEALRALPHRSLSSICHRAARLGVHRRRRWTAADDTKLRSLWGEIGVTSIARELERTVLTVYWRAQKLGLPLGVPQGAEYLSHAARRTGYSTAQLVRILRWAGVKVSRSLSRPRKARWHMRFVDPFDVDEALERWHATETVAGAARRVGVTPDTLDAWLMRAGVALPRVSSHHRRDADASRLHRRVESAVVDHVVAARLAAGRATETLSAAARRVGVTRATLGKWLVEAGRARPGYHWRVEPGDVDAVVRDHLSRPTCRARTAC